MYPEIDFTCCQSNNVIHIALNHNHTASMASQSEQWTASAVLRLSIGVRKNLPFWGKKKNVQHVRKKDGGILKKSHRGGNPLAGRTHMQKMSHLQNNIITLYKLHWQKIWYKWRCNHSSYSFGHKKYSLNVLMWVMRKEIWSSFCARKILLKGEMKFI